MGAAASSLIGSALGSAEGLTQEERQARVDLVTSIVAGVAAAGGLDSTTAGNAARIEVENNQLGRNDAMSNPFKVDLVKKYCATGTCSDKQVELLIQAQNQLMRDSGDVAVKVVGAIGATAVVAAVPVLASLAPEALALALSNPAAAVNAGIITVETAAAIATNSVTPGMAIEGAGKKAGTVWDSIVATQPVYPGSILPKSFELTLGSGQSIWVHGNATEHIAEYAQMIAKNNSPEVVRLATQQQLASLQGAVSAVTKNGVPFNQLIKADGWELKFAPPRQSGKLPVLIHALPTGK